MILIWGVGWVILPTEGAGEWGERWYHRREGSLSARPGGKESSIIFLPF